MSTPNNSGLNSTKSSAEAEEQASNFMKASLGLGLLRDIRQQETDEHVAKTQMEYRDGNMTWWRQRLKDRFGVNVPEPKEDDAVGSPTVRVDSPDNHYHYQQPNGLPDWLKAGILLGTGALAAWWFLRESENRTVENPKSEPVQEGNSLRLDPGGLKIEVVKDPEVNHD